MLQHVFTTLVHLFKFPWRYMLKDITSVYRCVWYIQVIGYKRLTYSFSRIYSERLLYKHQKLHIRQFAVESFSERSHFLMTYRCYEGASFLLYTVCVCVCVCVCVQLVDGVGQLLFEVCRGVKGQLHSCASKVISASQ